VIEIKSRVSGGAVDVTLPGKGKVPLSYTGSDGSFSSQGPALADLAEPEPLAGERVGEARTVAISVMTPNPSHATATTSIMHAFILELKS
jgi:hypothetical protein